MFTFTVKHRISVVNQISNIAPPLYFNRILGLAAVLVFGCATVGAAAVITLPGTGNQSTTTEPAISGGITGADSVLKDSTGEFYLDLTNNTYTGGTSITAGALRVKNNNSVGTGTINIGADGTFIINDELRKIHSTQFTRTITGTGTIQYTRQVDMYGDLSGFSGTIDQKGQHSIFSPVSGDASNVLIKNINVFCPVNNTDMLVKIGMINSGSGEIRPSSDAGTSGTVILQVGSSTAGNGTYAGSIMETEATKKLGVTKVGSNTWILTGGNLSYSGPTTVSDGMLQLGTEAILTTKLTNSAVTVSGGELRNYGSISKAITLTGGTLRNFGTIGDVNVTSGAPTIANNGSVTGTVTVKKGATLIGGTLGDVKVESGGAFKLNAGTAVVDLADAAYYVSGGQEVFNANCKITGTGTIYGSYQNTGGSINLKGDLSEFTGDYIINTAWNRGTNFQDNAANATGVRIKFEGSGTPLLTLVPGSTVNVGMISGTVGEIRPQAGGASSDVATFIVGNDTNYEDHTYGGTIIKNANSGKEIGITKTGSNTWTLTNASLTYGGPTAINGGTLEFTSTANLPNSAITLTGGTASAPATLKNAGTISKVVTVNNATNAAINNSGTLTNGVTLSGASTALTLDGTVALNATAGTLTTLNVNSGTTTLNALKNGVRQIATINVANGAELTFTVQNGLGSNKFVPNIVLNGGTLKSGFDGFANLGPVTLNGGVITDDPEKRTTSDYQNYGSLLFSSAINVTDDASITAGKIMIRCPGSSDGGAGKFTVADGKTLTVSSEIRLSDSNNVASSLEKLGPGNMVLTKDAKLTGAVNGSKVKVSAGKLSVTQGTNLGSVPIELTGTTLELLNTGTAASNFAFGSTVTGTGTISHKSTIGNAAAYPTITGNLSGFDGTLALNGTSAVLQSGQTMSNVVITNPNELCPVNSQSVALVTGTGGTIRPAGATASVATLVVGRDKPEEVGTFGGRIWNQSSGKTQAITKTGTNTWILNRDGDLEYTGATTVNGGVLQIGDETHATRLAGSAVTVNDGGTLVNYGTIAKAMTVKDGGTYQGMKDSTAPAGITFEDGSTIAFNLDDWDNLTSKLDLIGSTFGDTTVKLFSEEEPASISGKSFDLFETLQTNILDKITISSNLDGVVWTPSYVDNIVMLTASGEFAGVPEPATWLLLLIGLGGLLWFRKK